MSDLITNVGSVLSVEEAIGLGDQVRRERQRIINHPHFDFPLPTNHLPRPFFRERTDEDDELFPSTQKEVHIFGQGVQSYKNAQYAFYRDQIGGSTEDLFLASDWSLLDFLCRPPLKGHWHIDDTYQLKQPEKRMLVNLNRVDVALKYAVEWDPAVFVNAKHGQAPDDYYPAAFDVITYGPGEALVFTNPPERELRIPHVGVDFEQRVLMRIVQTRILA